MSGCFGSSCPELLPEGRVWMMRTGEVVDDTGWRLLGSGVEDILENRHVVGLWLLNY